jgi:hypothetical protein
VAPRGEQAGIELAVGGEPGAAADAAERLRHLEDVVLHRVEADRHSPEAGLAKRPSLRREQGAVRRHGEVAKVIDPRQLLDQALDFPPHEGLPSRDADLPRAAGDEDPREPSDLLERQQLLSLEEPEVATEDLLGMQ